MTRLVSYFDIRGKVKYKYLFASIILTVLYFASFGFNLLTLPLLIVLSIKMSQLFNTMYSHMDSIQSLIEIKDFEYSVIVGQASGDDISTTLFDFITRFENKKSKIYDQIGLIQMDLTNNESLSESLCIREDELDRYIKDFLNIMAISIVSGADTKKVGLIEYENMSRRIETELDIWSSYADKRLEVIMMLFIPPMIMMASGLSVGGAVSYIILALIYNLSIIIIFFSVCITEKILKGSI